MYVYSWRQSRTQNEIHKFWYPFPLGISQLWYMTKEQAQRENIILFLDILFSSERKEKWQIANLLIGFSLLSVQPISFYFSNICRCNYFQSAFKSICQPNFPIQRCRTLPGLTIIYHFQPHLVQNISLLCSISKGLIKKKKIIASLCVFSITSRHEICIHIRTIKYWQRVRCT